VTTFARTSRVLGDALDARVCSALTAEIGTAAGVAWQFADGRLAFEASAAPVNIDTVFDLASLTKVLATTTLALEHVVAGRLDLDAVVRDVIAEWRGGDRTDVRVNDLLAHASGLPAHRRYFERLSGRPAYERAIAAEPLDYLPRAKSVYSDLGFILLGFIVEDIGGQPLDVQFDTWRAASAARAPLAFRPPADWRPRTAATERDPWRERVLQGEVHDENTAALGGVAGHAGLFGTAAAVGEIARWWLHLLGTTSSTSRRTAIAAQFTTRTSIPGSSRALGWDTMLPTSSCGTRLSPRAIGHTGFTGTSLWLDPARDLYAVLLTNRVHPTRNNERIQPLRRAFHDALVADLEDE
jgi:serine-type D-Ala-D-Ala carboxypeptidase